MMANISTIILDRDGVINQETGYFVKSVDEWQPIAGSYNAISRLTAAGMRVFVATNQSGIARGLYSARTLDDIHTLMLDGVRQAGGDIEAVYYCPHADEDDCDCRKPRPGMLMQIVAEHGVDPDQSLMVGDSIRDLQAANSAGIRPVWLTRDPDPVALSRVLGDTASRVAVYPDLASFTDKFLEPCS